jgi:hypothetical protein
MQAKSDSEGRLTDFDERRACFAEDLNPIKA